LFFILEFVPKSPPASYLQNYGNFQSLFSADYDTRVVTTGTFLLLIFDY
jgi:hypothetical protein